MRDFNFKEEKNMVVQHNLTAMNSNRMLGLTQSSLTKSTEKLSSGYRVNRAADDAAGLAISEKMRRQVRGLTQASRNAQDGISAVQTAEGALNEVHDMLQRMNELATQAANDTNMTEDQGYINSEVQALKSEISRVASTTTFNETNLLDGSFTHKDLQVGSEDATDTSKTGQTIRVNIAKLSFEGITANSTQFADFVNKNGTTAPTGGKTALDVSEQAKAQSSISVIKTALQNVSTMRSALGAVQNRLEHTIKNLDNVVENTTAAESSVRDTDMATEMVRFSNNNILAQAGQSMLAQANQSNQGVLSLLG
jgi:flagellin